MTEELWRKYLEVLGWEVHMTGILMRVSGEGIDYKEFKKAPTDNDLLAEGIAWLRERSQKADLCWHEGHKKYYAIIEAKSFCSGRWEAGKADTIHEAVAKAVLAVAETFFEKDTRE